MSVVTSLTSSTVATRTQTASFVLPEKSITRARGRTSTKYSPQLQCRSCQLQHVHCFELTQMPSKLFATRPRKLLGSFRPSLKRTIGLPRYSAPLSTLYQGQTLLFSRAARACQRHTTSSNAFRRTLTSSSQLP